MISVFVGENSFEVEQKLKQLVAEFGGAPEKFDGAELEIRQLPDLFMGLSLFSEKRLVIVRGLSANKDVWDVLPDWLGRMSDDIHLVLVEPKPDKRTKSWKALQKVATVQELKPWTERDVNTAVRWVSEYAKEQGVELPYKAAQLLVARIGVDQWQLAQTVDKLSVYDEVTEEIIRGNTEAQSHENVFELFETALKGDVGRVQEMVATLSLSDDPYQTFGLLSGQAFQLAVLAVARDGDDAAKDIGAHPFVLSKLRPYATKLGVRKAGEVVTVFAEADEAMKTTSIDPWLAIEKALLKVAQG